MEKDLMKITLSEEQENALSILSGDESVSIMGVIKGGQLQVTEMHMSSYSSAHKHNWNAIHKHNWNAVHEHNWNAIEKVED